MTTRKMNEVWNEMAFAVLICFLVFQSSMGQEYSTSPTETTPNLTTQSANTNSSSTESAAEPAKGPNPVLTLETLQSPGAGVMVFTNEDEVLEFFDQKNTSITQKNSFTNGTYTAECVQEMPEISKEMVKFEFYSLSYCFDTINPATFKELCPASNCHFKIFQEKNSKTAYMTVKHKNDNVPGIADWLVKNKEKFGVASVGTKTSSEKRANVFWTLLVSGLVVAAGLIGACMWRNCSKGNSKGIKLAEDSCMVDEENQGNTLVSVAPLNPIEPQDKPSQNGESPEGVKTQNPPEATNGHSGTKTSDTEL